MGFDFRKLDKIEQAGLFIYDTIIEAMEEVEVELARDEDYEKAAYVRDEIKKIKDARDTIHTV